MLSMSLFLQCSTYFDSLFDLNPSVLISLYFQQCGNLQRACAAFFTTLDVRYGFGLRAECYLDLDSRND